MARTIYAPREEYIGDGTLDTYTFDFKVSSPQHIIVGVLDENLEKVFEVTGMDLTYLTSVSANTTGGGEITLAEPLPDGHRLYILQADDEPKQTSEFRNKGDFTLERFESALDALSGQIQRLKYQVSRSFKIGNGMSKLHANTFKTEVPLTSISLSEQDNRNKVLLVGEDNSSLQLGPSVTDLAAQAAAAAEGAAGAAAAQSAAEAEAAAAAAAAVLAEINGAKTMLNGDGPPDDALGEDGAFYIDKLNWDLYGPKTAGVWGGASTSMIGPQGIPGLDGADGAEGPAGADGVDGLITSLGNVGAIPNSKGMSEAAGVLTLQPADSINPGILTAGDQAIGGIKSFIGHIRRSVVSGLTAFAGGGQASAFQLAKDINRVTTVASADDSVKLPLALAGAEIVVINRGAQSMKVFPAVGEFIDNLAVDTAYSIPAGLNARFMCGVTGTWDTAAAGGNSVLKTGDTMSGDLRLEALLTLQEQIDSATTGANQTISPTKSFLKVTNAALASIHNIATITEGAVLVLVNGTGASLTIKNDTGGTASRRIKTGTGSDLTLADGASLLLVYDFHVTRWQVIGGSGGGGGLTSTAVQSLAAGATAVLPAGSRKRIRIKSTGGEVTSLIPNGTANNDELFILGTDDDNPVVIANSGNVRANGDLRFTAGVLHALVWDQTDTKWYQVGGI